MPGRARTDGRAGVRPLVLRPPGAVAVVAAGVLVLVTVAASGPGREEPWRWLLLAGPVLLLAAAFVLPALRVDGDGLVVSGVLRRHRVGWTVVREVQQDWFLAVDLVDGRRLVCLAVPVVGSMLAFRTWSDGDGSRHMVRDSTWIRPYPGAERSLAVELVAAHRPPQDRSRRDLGAVCTSWRAEGVAAVAVAALAVGAGAVWAVVT